MSAHHNASKHTLVTIVLSLLAGAALYAAVERLIFPSVDIVRQTLNAKESDLSLRLLHDQLLLRPDQEAKIQQVLADAIVKSAALKKDGQSQILALLDDDQRIAYFSIQADLKGTSTGYHLLIMLVCAEIFFFILRSPELKIIAKRTDQRTTDEKGDVARGLLRSLVLEVVIFIPTSVCLVFLIVRPFLWPIFINRVSMDVKQSQMAFNGLLGIVSYGFPFVTIRHLVTRIALNSLKEFASIGHPVDKPQKGADTANA
jgi:hypothetical protein